MNYLPSRCAALGAAVVLSLPLSVVKAEGDRDSAPASGQTAAVNAVAPTAEVASAGVVIAKDKVTGELRPATAKEIKKLRKTAEAKSAETKAKAGSRPVAPVETYLANGAVVTTLDPSTEVFSVAVKGADGKVHTTCVPGDKVEAVMAAAQSGNLTKKEVLDEK